MRAHEDTCSCGSPASSKAATLALACTVTRCPASQCPGTEHARWYVSPPTQCKWCSPVSPSGASVSVALKLQLASASADGRRTRSCGISLSHQKTIVAPSAHCCDS